MGKIILTIGVCEDWTDYMPGLIRMARQTRSTVHVLETATPPGAGEFTSNMIGDDEYPTPERLAEAREARRQVLVAGDTAAASRKTTAFLDAVARHLRQHGLEVTTEWLPDFDRATLGEYARRIGADTVALIRRGWWAELMQGNYRPILRRAGLKVVDLQPSALEPVAAATGPRSSEMRR